MSKRLIEEVVKAGGYVGHRPAAEQAVKAVFDALDTLTRTRPVQVRGFGTFQRKYRKARTGRDPRTGEPIPIPAKEVLTFRSVGKN